MRRVCSNLTVIAFASFLAALVVVESLSKGDCQGDWFGGECKQLGSRTCRECLEEAIVTLGFREGKCEETRCEWMPGWVCPTDAGIIFTNNTMTTPCNCNGEDGPGFQSYDLDTDEEGNPVYKKCADVYACSPIWGCIDIDGVSMCRQDVNQPQPTVWTCATYKLAGGDCNCFGG